MSTRVELDFEAMRLISKTLSSAGGPPIFKKGKFGWSDVLEKARKRQINDAEELKSLVIEECASVQDKFFDFDDEARPETKSPTPPTPVSKEGSDKVYKWRDIVEQGFGINLSSAKNIEPVAPPFDDLRFYTKPLKEADHRAKERIAGGTIAKGENVSIKEFMQLRDTPALSEKPRKPEDSTKDNRAKERQHAARASFLPRREEQNVSETGNIASNAGVHLSAHQCSPRNLRPFNVLASPEYAKVPQLQHELNRVLFSPGVHFFRCPRTGVYNYSAQGLNLGLLQKFDYGAVPQFTPPSKDEKFLSIARRSFKFAGSTSSLKSAIIKCYLTLSNDREIDGSYLSKKVSTNPYFQKLTLTWATRMPATLQLKWNNGVFSIDKLSENNKEEEEPSVLSLMGTAIELMLTVPREEFKKYLGAPLPAELREELLAKHVDNYHTGGFGDIAVRSQIDCWNPLLPKKTFDIKSRAVFPVRLDPSGHESYSDYRLYKLTGKIGSFEREYFDMARSIMLGYSLQARMGNMDGVFVAYHNAGEMHGFQYLSLEEMDKVVFGSTFAAEEMVKASFNLLSHTLNTAIEQMPDSQKSMRITLACTPTATAGDKRRTKLTGFVFGEGSLSDFPMLKIDVEVESRVCGERLGSKMLSLDPAGMDQWDISYKTRVQKLQVDAVSGSYDRDHPLNEYRRLMAKFNVCDYLDSPQSKERSTNRSTDKRRASESAIRMYKREFMADEKLYVMNSSLTTMTNPQTDGDFPSRAASELLTSAAETGQIVNFEELGFTRADLEFISLPKSHAYTEFSYNSVQLSP